jgi:hypothetical protein
MKSMTKDAAEEIAVDAMTFLVSDHDLMERFLALTGLTPETVRVAARQPGFLANVLRHILESEPVLMEFAEHAQLRPEDVVSAARALGATEVEQ